MRVSALLVFFAVALLLPLNSQAQRVAWVVGNSDYADGTLPNPVNDAKLVSDSLEALGFQVQLDLNLTSADEFGASAQRVLSSLGEAEVFLFYYAGHGIQVDNENYLIPTKADPQDEYGIKRECFPITELIGRYQKVYSEIPFVAVLDACRVNPFERKWSRSYGSGKGLSKMSAPTGSLIAYSTEYGTTAADGNGANSDYALAFAQAIGQPGLSIQEAFQEVRRLVLEASNGVQVPVEQTKLTAQLILRQLPDLSAQQMRGIFDDFEEVLKLGFQENALLFGDSLIGVERKFELVKHYANELDPSQSNLVNRWKHLQLFHLLYQLQNSRGEDDNGSLGALQNALSNDMGNLDPSVALVASEFNDVLNVERAQEFISLSELDSMSLSIGELKFAAAYQLEDLILPEINFENEREGPYSELTRAFLQSEFILAFEDIVLNYAAPNGFRDWDAASIRSMCEYHKRLALEMADTQNRAYSMGANFLFLADLCLSESTGSRLAKERQNMLKKDWIETLQPVFDVELEIKEFPEVANVVEIVLIQLNDVLDEEIVTLTPEVNQALAAFFERELPKVLDACSGSYFDFYAQGRRLVDHGWIYPINVMPDDEQFAVNILDQWDCFVLGYLQNENSNELDVLLDDFLERCWNGGTFEGAEITSASWQALSEKHVNLLRLTGKVATLEFAFSTSRIAAATIGTVNSHQLLAFLQEYWNLLSMSNEEIFQSFGRSAGEYGIAISAAQEIFNVINADDLTCYELIQFKTLLEALLEAHLDNYLSEEDGIPSVASALPRLISALQTCIHQHDYYSDCVVDSRYDWNTLDSLNSAIAQRVLQNPGALQYFEDQMVVERAVEEFVDLEDFEGLLDFLVLRERLFHDGSLNTIYTSDFVESLQRRNRKLKEFDIEGSFEFYFILLLGEIVYDASEDLLLGRKPASICEQNIASILGVIEGYRAKARNNRNQSIAFSVLVDAKQNYFHRTGQRFEGARVILEAVEKALIADKIMGWDVDPDLLYVQAEEYSCISDYQKAIPIWKVMVEDLDYWDIDDHNQFAQNLFLDLLEYEGVSDTHYEELFEAIGLSANELEGDLTSSDLDGSVLTLQAAVEDAWPIVEFTNASGQNTLMFQRPDLQWKLLESNQKLGAIMTLRDTSHVACHGYSYGQIDVSDPDLGEDIVVFSNQTSRDSFSEWKILLPEMLGSMSDVSSIRTGFYWGGLSPTGHTQDLKYLTYLTSQNIEP